MRNDAGVGRLWVSPSWSINASRSCGGTLRAVIVMLANKVCGDKTRQLSASNARSTQFVANKSRHAVLDKLCEQITVKKTEQ